MRDTLRRVLAGAAAAAALTACGEPAVDLAIPERNDGQHVADLADVLADDTETTVADSDLDVAVLTYETAQASCGEAFRAAKQLVAAWDADVAVVAVARPGDFASTATGRERCLGVQPRDDAVVGGDVRERIAEQIVPPLASANDWDGAVSAAVEALSGE